ncbi:endonuclease III [Staphylococcus aureus]|nr:endonuclease III [Staphylococcus aureus]
MIDVIANMFPDAECELKHDNPFELTIAVLLSAQCTDVLVNRVTTELFKNTKRLKIIWQSVMKNL